MCNSSPAPLLSESHDCRRHRDFRNITPQIVCHPTVIPECSLQQITVVSVLCTACTAVIVHSLLTMPISSTFDRFWCDHDKITYTIKTTEHQNKTLPIVHPPLLICGYSSLS